MNRTRLQIVGLLSGLLVLLATAAGLFGCSGDTVRPRDPDRPEIGWIAPAANDTLRGTAELAAWVDLGVPVSQVSFFVDGEEIATRTTPPWTTVWRPPVPSEGPELRSLEVGVAAKGDGVQIRGEPLRVWYRRDDPPTLVLEPPGRTDWVEIGPDLHIAAVAYDREDGTLDPTAVQWQSDDGRRIRGAHFPTEFLRPGDHHLVAWVTDSAGNECQGEIHVRSFSFEGRDSAIGAARDLQRALSALDLAAVGALLHPEFQVRSCHVPVPTPAPDPLSRTEFLSSLESAISDPALERLWWDGSIELQGGETRGWALARWKQLGILVGSRSGEWRTVGLSAELVLRKGSDGGWQVSEWRERDPGDGPGVAGLLRSPLPPSAGLLDDDS